ncbi:MAG: hypothetical protein GY779_02265, partial [Gammaproteobacteria bacterium]|nr:hypothetical protein [Gammaproteobacteria bacterium]
AKLDDAGQVVVLGENVTHTGSIHASSELQRAGQIELHAQNTTELRENAVISAQATQSGVGGEIKLLGKNLGLFDTAKVNASGANGGGEILIGGDRQGLNPSVRNAEFIYLGEEASVNADASGAGDGGKVITFAEDTARIYGELAARGGAQGGDGGFIETSGKRGFELPRAPDVSAVAGDGGLWLIDPYDITIVNGDGSGTSNINSSSSPYFSDDTPAVLEIDTILLGLYGGDVEIETVAGDGGGESGDIYFGDNITIAPAILNYNGINATRSLTLRAEGDIEFVGESTITDSDNADEILNVNLFAKGSILLNALSSIKTNGGNFTVGGASGNTPTTFTNSGTIDTSGIDGPNRNTAGTYAGNINITASGAFTSGILTANGGKNKATSTSGSAINGADGGAITIDAGSVVFSDAIDASGSAARINSYAYAGGADGGNAGSISLTATTGDINISNDLNAIGGDAAGNNYTGPSADVGNGGDGGTIILTADVGSVSAGIISTRGGTAVGKDVGQNGENNAGFYAQSGNAGDITINATSGTITLNADMEGRAGVLASKGSAGTGGVITLNGNTVLAASIDMLTDIGDGNQGTDGDDGSVIFNGQLNGSTARTEGLTLTSGAITFAGNVGSINTERLGNLTLNATGAIDAGVNSIIVNSLTVNKSASFISGSINTEAGAPTQMAKSVDGNDGGAVTLVAADITVGAITTKGSDAVVGTGDSPGNADGGDGGVMTITAEDDDTPSITLNGDIITEAGKGTVIGGGSGTLGGKIITLKGSGDATLTIGSGVTFSTVVTVTSNTSGSDTVTVTDGPNVWLVTSSNTDTLNTNLK